MNTRTLKTVTPLAASVAVLATLSTFLVSSISWAENEVGFIERFALAEDREKALGELVPGSEDYYYFSALHYQNTRNEEKLAEILEAWKDRSPEENARRRIIENREAILDYATEPQKTVAYLKERLGVEFNHVQEARDQKPDLPTTLDQGRIAREVFLKDALANDGGLESLSETALEQLVATKAALNLQQQRAVLGRLTRPDVAELVPFVVAELKEKDAGGFGAFGIHRALLPEQLDALAKLVPSLATNEAFVFTKMRKLAPGADVDVEFDVVEREAWLERVWDYAKTLPPAFNTLKAHILFRRLDHDRRKGVYDEARFLEYLKLPRDTDYVNPKWMERERERQPVCNPIADLREPLLDAQRIGDDEPLVREVFLALFDKAATANLAALDPQNLGPWTDYVRDSWLKPLFAEAMITGGHGNPNRWASLLTPTAFAQLKDRVDIEFPATNAQTFAPGEAVQFDVTVKNTPKLIVRIYELNALNFFQTQKRQLNTDVNLDGLVANVERTQAFDDGPFKRVRQTFKFPEMKGRGAWIVEFIGGGRSSRALVRVGQWQVVQHTGPAGDLLTVLDEKAEPVKDAVVWLDGRKYTPDEKMGGRITVPFTAQPGRRQVVISDAAGTFATLTEFVNHKEDYKLDAQFHIEREQLLARRTATICVRTALMLGESHLDPALIKEPRLIVSSLDREGISTTKEFADLKLSAGADLTQEISVPDRLASLAVTLAGKVEVLSAGGETRDVAVSHKWDVNGIDATVATNDGHMSKFGDDYVFELLGKNGEPVADQQLVFELSHRGFDRWQHVSLKTDAKGRVTLGALGGIAHIVARTPLGREGHWTMDDFERTWPETVNVAAQRPFTIPAPPAFGPGDVSLLQINAGSFVADYSAKLAVKDGFLVAQSLPPGDYSLRLRGEQRDIAIKVSGGKLSNGWFLGAARNLEATATAPLQITGIADDKDFVTIKVANATPFTRVHIAATRFDPGTGLFGSLGNFGRFDASEGVPARLPNLFSSGREIGDEYRYILERRYSKSYPGNMLTRPGLLLNPWAIRDTGLTELAQKGGQQAAQTDGERGESMLRRAKLQIADPTGRDDDGRADETNLDFLADAAPVLYNLIPDKDGVVKIDRKALGDRQHVQVFAGDLVNAVWRSFALPEVETKFTDLRLARNLDPAKLFAERKEVTVLEKGRTLTLDDILTSEMETYDTLGGIHSLFTSLCGNEDETLAKFAWVLDWPKLNDVEKRAKYGEFACHELNFFLAKKDAAFFDAVIRPYLANKKDKTFMDDFLIGRDLAGYTEPSAYAQLNSAERALLGVRIATQAEDVSRNLRELWELIVPDPEAADRMFETALRGFAMEAEQPQIPQTFGAHDPAAPAIPGLDSPAPPGGQGLGGGAGAFNKAKKDAATRWAAPTDDFAAAGAAPAKPGAPASLRSDAEREVQLGRKVEKGLALNRGEMEKLAKLAESDGKPFSDEALGQRLAEKAGEAEYRERALKESVIAGRKSAADMDGDGLADAREFVDLNENVAGYGYFGGEAANKARELYRSNYRQLGTTKEWAENNYYHVPIVEQNAAIVPANAFWRDYAAWVAGGSKGAFVSPNVTEAAGNFSEMMLALAVLDLPFDVPKHTSKAEAGAFTFTAGGTVIVFHKQIKPAVAADAQAGRLLVSETFFREGDRYRQEGNEKFEKYVTDEFLTGVVYGANVVVTNPTSAPVKAELLMQIPQGALPVSGSKATDSKRVDLASYTTQTFEYRFYFPSTPKSIGTKFPHFPVNVAVAAREPSVSAAKAFAFNVVSKLTQVDKASWGYVSQYASDAELFTFLGQNNLAALDFTRVAWRCRDAAFFKRLTTFLIAHHVWDETVFSYALVHNDAAALREWLKHKDAFLSECGPYLSAGLILLDPIERRAYEHLEYSPLVNQRAHKLGADWRIANPDVLGQYQSFLGILAHKDRLDATDQLSAAYYLFLQDRIEPAIARMDRVALKGFKPLLQYDYMRCYANFYESKIAEARAITAKYADHPVPRWRALFAEVLSQADEIEGKAAAPAKDGKEDREKQQSALAATEPVFDFKVESKAIALTWRNLGEVAVNYYLMDPEFAFSSSPFVSGDTARFSIIKPAKTVVHALPKDADKLDLALPAEFAKANVVVEILGAGQRRALAHYANTLKLAVTENYGRLEARDAAGGAPISAAYVKVYARLKNGAVRFLKDGYTDRRGRFDYASINGGGAEVLEKSIELPPANGLDYRTLKPAEIGQIAKLAILILSETHGAATREVAPPRE